MDHSRLETLVVLLVIISITIIPESKGLKCYQCNWLKDLKMGDPNCASNPRNLSKAFYKSCPKTSQRCLSVSGKKINTNETGIIDHKNKTSDIIVRRCSSDMDRAILKNIYSPMGCLQIDFVNAKDPNTLVTYHINSSQELNATIRVGRFCYCDFNKCNQDVHGLSESIHHGLKILILSINAALLYGGIKIIF